MTIPTSSGLPKYEPVHPRNVRITELETRVAQLQELHNERHRVIVGGVITFLAAMCAYCGT